MNNSNNSNVKEIKDENKNENEINANNNNNNNNINSNDNNFKHFNLKFKYFMESRKPQHEKLKQEIFKELLKYDLKSIEAIIEELLTKYFGSQVPGFVIDEIGELHRFRHGDFTNIVNIGAIEKLNPRDYLRDDLNKNKQLKNPKSIFDTLVGCMSRLATTFGVVSVGLGTTLSIVRLTGGNTSAFQGTQVCPLTPVKGLCPQRVANVIENYLNIKLNPRGDICRRWSGRAGIFCVAYLNAFLNKCMVDSQNGTKTRFKDSDEWKKAFLDYESKAITTAKEMIKSKMYIYDEKTNQLVIDPKVKGSIFTVYYNQILVKSNQYLKDKGLLVDLVDCALCSIVHILMKHQ